MDKLSHLTASPFSELSHKDWTVLFDWARENRAPATTETDQNPIGDDFCVFQYWHDTPDEQVSQLLAMTRTACEDDGIKWRLFNEKEARTFLNDALGERYLAAFDKCYHQAMKADLFRLCFMSVKGGMWLDADLALTQSPRNTLSLGLPLFHQRVTRDGELTNWFMAAHSQDEIILDALKRAMVNLEDTAFLETAKRSRQVYNVAGPVVLEAAAAAKLQGLLKAGGTVPPVTIIDETIHDALIATGRQVFKETLKYKKTDASWQFWGKEPSQKKPTKKEPTKKERRLGKWKRKWRKVKARLRGEKKQ